MGIRSAGSATDQCFHHIYTLLVNSHEDSISVLIGESIGKVSKLLGKSNLLGGRWIQVLLSYTVIMVLVNGSCLISRVKHIHLIESQILK